MNPKFGGLIQCFLKADVVVYLLRADSRDYAIDEVAFKKLFRTSSQRSRVILALNCCDKIEPINRTIPFIPTTEQKNNIRKKIHSVQSLFNDATVIPYSAIEKWNLTELSEEIMRKILMQTDIKFSVITPFSRSFVSR